MLRTQISELEGRTSRHQVQPDMILRRFLKIEPGKPTFGIAAVMEVVQRHLIEEAITLEGMERSEVAESPSFTPKLRHIGDRIKLGQAELNAPRKKPIR